MRAATQPAKTVPALDIISIHAAHAGSDNGTYAIICKNYRFQSTLPMRAATSTDNSTFGLSVISIHAAHAGSDRQCSKWYKTGWDFNPRCPCGQRRESVTVISTGKIFQSTLPMRAATALRLSITYLQAISIHAAHAGSDLLLRKLLQSTNISIHAAHAGSDLVVSYKHCGVKRFQSTLPMRAATDIKRTVQKEIGISIHAAHAGSDQL